jgi:hypothetical protein
MLVDVFFGRREVAEQALRGVAGDGVAEGAEGPDGVVEDAGSLGNGQCCEEGGGVGVWLSMVGSS